MLKDLIIIPNFFDNPNELVALSKQHKFYSRSEHPQDKNSRVTYKGKRTEELVGKKEKDILNETFYRKVISDNISNDSKINYSYYGTAFFHYFENDYLGGEPEIHQDSALMAGVIYLNPCHLDNPENHGTIIFNKNNDTFTMPYVYNTMIMYRSDYPHAPLTGFGNNVDNARLSMIFSIDKFTLEVSRNTL
jgi:hypothetical protein